uniref:G-protein coupled receptors family 1 profile domain-containing protein n=1 Tax=Gorilla gorilla gorilla TaxID=9595 RepID=A0A2I2ZVS0_GORGO
MTNLNASHANHRNFILTGIPGTPDKNPWLAFPLDTLTLLGNGTILAVIKVEPSLHEPTYYFLSILALTDVSLSLSTLPFMLSIYDLWPSETHYTIALPFCHSNVLSHSYCLHQNMMRLACASTRVNSLYGLIAVIFTLGLDVLLTLLSYVLTLKTVLGIVSRGERLKTLSTCLSHMSAVLLFYVPFMGASMIHRFWEHLSPVVHMVMLLLPPVLNPIVYSVKTRQI